MTKTRFTKYSPYSASQIRGARTKHKVFPNLFKYLYLVVVGLVPEPVPVGGVGDDVAAGEVGHHHSLAGQGQVQRGAEPGGGVQGPDEGKNISRYGIQMD